MKKIVFIVLTAFMVTLAAAGCTSTQAPVTGEGSSRQATGPSVAVAAKGDRGWEELVAAAKKEGKIVAYGSGGPSIREELAPKLLQRYGIEMEFVSAKGAQLTEKMDRERRSGLYFVDIYIGGPTTLLNELKPKGFLDPMDPALVLPEVKNQALWVGNRLSFVDKDQTILAFAASTDTSLAYNTDLVKPGEVKGYKDLLAPKWKGKLLMGDPTVAGTAAQWYSMVAAKIMGVDYMRQLSKQEPVIVRDLRMQVEWLARGKYPVLIVPHSTTMTEFREAGAPVTEIIPEEGTFLKSGGGNLGLVNRAAHPSAARVFVNWLLSAEGGLLWQKATGQQSARTDVPLDYMDPLKVRREGIKYVFGDDEEFLMKQPEQMKEAAGIFGHLMK
ncbi:MAG: extracellular solute-binding protein [Chloroflexi bacterium]|nr:extracellular solute-binding protein [Chloroflexota bacterium]